MGELGISGSFIEIALNSDQIRDYDLPPFPTKKSDSRSLKFIDEFGDNAVELDALDPDILQKLVEKSINSHWSLKIYENNLDIEVEYQEFFNEKIEGMS